MQMHRATACYRDSLNALASDEAADLTSAICCWEYRQSTWHWHDSPYTNAGPVTGPVDTLHSTRSRICNADIGPCKCTVQPCRLVRLYSPPASSSALTTTVCCCRLAKPLHKARHHLHTYCLLPAVPNSGSISSGFVCLMNCTCSAIHGAHNWMRECHPALPQLLSRSAARAVMCCCMFC